MFSPVRLHQHLRMLQFSCGGFSGGKSLVEMRLFLCGSLTISFFFTSFSLSFYWPQRYDISCQLLK
jgi:hypothetical protein